MPCSSQITSEMVPEIHAMEKYYFLKLIIHSPDHNLEFTHSYLKKVKVSHRLIAIGAVEVRVPLYLGHS